MILLNFSHPITSAQLSQVENIIGSKILNMIEIHVDFDIELPFEKQLSDLLDGLPLTNKQWQTEPIIINLPALNYISAALIANLHGRMGYFPPILRLHLQPDSLQYKVAEIIYLQSVRNQGRKSRYIDKSESEP